MKHYTTSAMGVVTDPNTIVTVEFMGGECFHGPLGELTDWVRERRVNIPKLCTTEAGRHGIYPVLHVRNQRVAAACSMLRRHQVKVGDGLTFSSRAALRECYALMVRAGISVDHSAVCWGITELPYANAPQTLSKLAAPKQLSLDEQMADSPFA